MLAWKYQGPGAREELRFQNPFNCSQQYYIQVFSFNGSSSTSAQYTLVVGRSY